MCRLCFPKNETHPGESGRSLFREKTLGTRNFPVYRNPPSPWLVSACLVGVPCRHDGAAKPSPAVLRFLAGKRWLPICPEILSGAGAPRPAVSFRGGDGEAVLDGSAIIVDEKGREATEKFVEGCRRAFRIAEAAGIVGAVLKERSPACGTRTVHVDGRPAAGRGVLAALARRAGWTLLNEDLK